MSQTDETRWFGVRTLYLWSPDSLYEERVTLWRANSLESAIDLAEREAREYCVEGLGVEYLGFSQAYDTSLTEPRVQAPTEVFSLMRRSDLGPGDYIDRFFDTGEERANRLE